MAKLYKVVTASILLICNTNNCQNSTQLRWRLDTKVCCGWWVVVVSGGGQKAF